MASPSIGSTRSASGPPRLPGAIPNTLTFTDSTPGNTLNVLLGASGVVDESTYDPIVVLTGPNVEARHGIALATETGNDDILLVLRGAGMSSTSSSPIRPGGWAVTWRSRESGPII